jgi:hypothetical protein
MLFVILSIAVGVHEAAQITVMKTLSGTNTMAK